MSLRRLRNVVALLIVGGHLSSFTLLILTTIVGAFSVKWTTTSSGILGPLFAVYVGMVLKSLSDETNSQNSYVGGTFSLIALAFISLFSLSIPILIVLKALNRISNFDEFKVYLSIIETACAASVGSIVDTLFGNRTGDNTPAPRPKARDARPKNSHRRAEK